MDRLTRLKRDFGLSWDPTAWPAHLPPPWPGLVAVLATASSTTTAELFTARSLRYPDLHGILNTVEEVLLRLRGGDRRDFEFDSERGWCLLEFPEDVVNPPL